MTPTPPTWDAARFFSRLAQHNRLALAEGFTFHRVAGLDGFEETLHTATTHRALFCLSDTAEGYTELCETPHTRRLTTVFLALRHPLDDMRRREACFDTLRELFRQVMSLVIQERLRLQEGHLYLDPRVAFHEIPRYFLTGCACAYFQLAIDTYTDLRYRPEEWTL